MEALVSKVKLGRCTLLLEKEEVMSGFAAIGKDFLADRDIGKAPVFGLKPGHFHFGISRRHPEAGELLKLIDEELTYMEASGKLVELWKKMGKQPNQ